MTDIEIARAYKMEKIEKIAKKISLKKSDLVFYGEHKAKIKNVPQTKKQGKLVLVTAINPTSSGNGKTTVSIGLCDALNLMHKKSCLALREPSLGPVFGVKGGATGGGQSQIVPMEDINLHFNGDFHAITSANNLLSSLIDNHIFHGNKLDIDKNKIFFKRCLDCNDRCLRDVNVATNSACERYESFTITAASEIMAIMCLAKDLTDLKERLGNIMVALNTKGKPIYAKDLQAQDAMAILLKDALMPNLVQTLGKSPAIVHCGPFANIAHGCNSIVATKTALALSDYCITEAGFGADLGAEKFFDLKCRINNLKPNCVVLIATVRALKLHGGVDPKVLAEPNPELVEKGLPNLIKHIDSIKNVFKLPLVVTANKFTTDSAEELAVIENACKKLGVAFAVNDVWGQGGKGAIELAKKVEELCNKDNNDFAFAYDLTDSVKVKIQKIAKKCYGASKVEFTKEALDSIKTISKLKLNDLPVIMAKTQSSLTDDPKIVGAPKSFTITVRDVEIRTGAGFLVAILGKMMLMPGLSKTPAAVKMNIDENGIIEGLF